MTNVYPFSSTETEPHGTAGTAITPEASAAMLMAAVEWVQEKRGISKETLAALGVTCATRFFGDVQRGLPALIFRYSGADWKARSFPDKHFTASKGFQMQFWNLERVLAANPKEVYLVEGELDACSLVEAGVPQDRVLSVPNGAKLEAADDPRARKGYSYVQEALQRGLSRATKFIWCGDKDEAGKALRADMARLLPVALFHYVEWPDGYKDANDVLLGEGGQFLLDWLGDHAKPWPIDGLFRLSDLPDPPPFTLWDPGFPEWEGKVRLAPKTLSVVTGQPNHGKTTMFQQIWFNVVKRYDLVACMMSFETRPKPHIRRQLRTLHSGKLEVAMLDSEIVAADKWINDHYLFLIHPENRPTLAWFLDMAGAAVVRYGAKIIQLDPWNRLEASRQKNESETDYIANCLRELYAFAVEMNCHVQILGHPSKMDGARRGEPPSLEDISGSKHWENMVDQGFVVYRPKLYDDTGRKTDAQLLHRKARFEELGYPCRLQMDYRVDQGRYVSADYQAGYG